MTHYSDNWRHVKRHFINRSLSRANASELLPITFASIGSSAIIIGVSSINSVLIRKIVSLFSGGAFDSETLALLERLLASGVILIASPEKIEPGSSSFCCPPFLIRELCTRSMDIRDLGATDLAFRNLVFDEKLILSDVEVSLPLLFRSCEFRKGLALRGAGTHSVALESCLVSSLDADNLRVAQALAFSDCKFTPDTISLRHASIGADFSISNCSFSGGPKNSFDAEGISVKGDIEFDNTFIEAECSLLGANLGGSLVFRATHLRNKAGAALSADDIVIRRNIHFTEECSAAGEVRFLGGKVKGGLEIQGGRFESQDDRPALSLNGATLGEVFISTITCVGMLVATASSIGGSFSIVRSTFQSSSENTILLDRMEAKHDVFVGQGTVCVGGISAHALRIDGCLGITDGIIVRGGVDLSESEIGRSIIVGDMNGSSETTLSLRDSRAAAYYDDPLNWPSQDSLFLKGLKYDHLNTGTTADERLRWLSLQPESEFSPQSYQQLSAVLRSAGDDSGSRRVLIQMHELKRKLSTLSIGERLWLFFVSFVGYGYSLARIGLIAAILVVFSTFLFAQGFRHKLYECPAVASVNLNESAHLTAFVYSLDVLMPVITLGYSESWEPNFNQTAAVIQIGLITFRLSPSMLWYWELGLRVFGWLFATLLISFIGLRLRQ